MSPLDATLAVSSSAMDDRQQVCEYSPRQRIKRVSMLVAVNKSLLPFSVIYRHVISAVIRAFCLLLDWIGLDSTLKLHQLACRPHVVS